MLMQINERRRYVVLSADRQTDRLMYMSADSVARSTN